MLARVILTKYFNQSRKIVLGEKMPLGKEDMDEIVGLRYKNFLGKMEKGKFYSIGELFGLVVGKKFNEKSPLDEYYQSEKKGEHPTLRDTVDAMVSLLMDLAYLESVIESQCAVGNLQAAFKKDLRYYSKV
jgi:hypothetical protein